MKNLFKATIVCAACALFALGAQQAKAQTPRAEYPRPQFERSTWQNLNGKWSYTFDFGRSGKQQGFEKSQGFDGKITVPFCPESKLSGVEHKDFINSIWYHRLLTVPSDWQGRNVMLHFGASDYETTIYIDGKFVAQHFGSSSSFAVDITKFAIPGRTVNLVVCVNDDLRGGKQPGGKQSTQFNSYGCSYTRTTGIWQTVWMEPVAPCGLRQVVATPDIDQKQLVIRPSFHNESMDNTLTVKMLDGGKVVAQKTVNACNENIVVLPVKNLKLWSPESPFLYDLVYTVKDKNGNVVDEVKSYAGMRKVHIANGYFYLNNQPYFQRLVLDQGFYPDGVWTAPSDEALKKDIEMSKAAGFNGARLHQKVFEERFHYWADKLGYLTWGEFDNWCLNENDDLAARNLISEWLDIVERDRNHPSIVTWTPFNETWGCREGAYVRFMNDVYNHTKAVDPTRPINDASGDGHIKTDIWSVHDYSREAKDLIEHHTFKPGVEPFRNQPAKEFLAKYNGQPYMVDEFGGLPWIKESERAGSWGYGNNIDNIEDFYNILEKQIDALKACKHVVGFCYTQLTDVEQEKNGIYYYDRSTKFDMDRIKKIFEKIPSIIENPQDLSDWKKVK